MKIVINGPASPMEIPGIIEISGKAEFVCTPGRERLAEAKPLAKFV